MPTPVAHSLAGLAVHLAAPQNRGVHRPLAALALICIANLPDIDYLPGYLAGDPRAYHWGPTHSFFAAVLVGAMAGGVARLVTGRFMMFFLLATAAYGSHVMLDLLLGPMGPGRGLQALWPASAEPVMAPVAVFHMFPRAVAGMDPVRLLFTSAVLPLIVRELVVMIPVCAVAYVLGRRRRPLQQWGAGVRPACDSGPT